MVRGESAKQNAKLVIPEQHRKDRGQWMRVGGGTFIDTKDSHPIQYIHSFRKKHFDKKQNSIK